MAAHLVIKDGERWKTVCGIAAELVPWMDSPFEFRAAGRDGLGFSAYSVEHPPSDYADVDCKRCRKAFEAFHGDDLLC